MLTTKNIHLAILGIIIGSVTAYVFASYQADARRQAQAAEAIANTASSAGGHEDLSDEEMLALFEEALAGSPNDPELMSQLGNFLFGLQRFSEAAEWFGRVLEVTPQDSGIRTLMGTSLYAAGRLDEAIEALDLALQTNPDQILALHTLAIAHLDQGAVSAAQEALARMEELDPTYIGLESVRSRIDGAQLGSDAR